MCNSHVTPSAMYLKHRSQTHSIEFSPSPWVRPKPPASKSEVRPWDRIVARWTPGILGACEEDDDAPWEATATSSASDSVRGYGEKYLNEES